LKVEQESLVVLGEYLVSGMFRSLIDRIDGSVALVFGITAPVLIGVAGIAVDYARFNSTRADLQGLADGAAVAAVQSMAVANMTSGATAATVDSYVKSNAEGIAWQKGDKQIVVATKVDSANNAVDVQLSKEWKPMLAHVLIGEVKTPVVVESTAKMVGSGKACVIGLNTIEDKTVHADDASRLTGQGCGIFSNSTAEASIMVDKSAQVNAQLICSAGGANVKMKGNVSPDVTEDCPAMDDPLASRPAPAVGACDFTNHTLSLPSLYKLKPGVYCGGLTINAAAVVELDEGTYVIKDGPLTVTGAAIVKGVNVGFYLTGTNARFEFGPLSTISFEAPKMGPMAGLLFFEDRSNSATTHIIKSNNARNLLGTVYLPKSKLELSSNAIVATDSAYTALVVNTLRVREGPNVVLNSDYDATDVPVPPGLIGGKVILTQ
jgi:Flp pilus assembly protein TadG